MNWLVLRILLVVCGIVVSACGSSSATTARSAARQEQPVPSVLTDGTFDCEVTNITRGNGPYTLECEKSGGDLTIHFNNGGYIIIDLDSQVSPNGSTWELEGTNLQTGDSWEVTINQ